MYKKYIRYLKHYVVIYLCDPLVLAKEWVYHFIKNGYRSALFDYENWSITRKSRQIGFENAIPWITYDAKRWLTPKLNNSMKVFEWGSGGSTIYFSKYVKSVDSIETEKIWLENVKDYINKKNIHNINIHHIPSSSKNRYLASISIKNNRYDVILIDGSYREKCIEVAIKYIKKGGFIILDNSERIEYREAKLKLIENNFSVINFYGLGPINNYPWMTSIYFRDYKLK